MHYQMNKQVVSNLKEEFGPVEYHSGSFKRLPGNWFLLKLNPLPPEEEIELVVSDICQAKHVSVYEGQVRHSDKCNNQEHKFSTKMRKVKKALGEIKDEYFFVAVYPGKIDSLNNQPVAIPLEPEINYAIYPDHPHLNEYRITQVEGVDFFLPPSLCYTDTPCDLGDDQYERLLAAFDLITIWLFRHQVWLAMRKQNLKPIWIGPEADLLPPEAYPKILNPQGKCRCSSQKKYLNCHMQYDLEKRAEKLCKASRENYPKTLMRLKKKYLSPKRWENEIYKRQNFSLNILKNRLSIKDKTV